MLVVWACNDKGGSPMVVFSRVAPIMVWIDNGD